MDHMRKTDLQTPQLKITDFKDKSLILDDDPLRGRLSRAMEEKGFYGQRGHKTVVEGLQ